MQWGTCSLRTGRSPTGSSPPAPVPLKARVRARLCSGGVQLDLGEQNGCSRRCARCCDYRNAEPGANLKHYLNVGTAVHETSVYNAVICCAVFHGGRSAGTTAGLCTRVADREQIFGLTLSCDVLPPLLLPSLPRCTPTTLFKSLGCTPAMGAGLDDTFSLIYSSKIYALCHIRPSSFGAGSLVLLLLNRRRCAGSASESPPAWSRSAILASVQGRCMAPALPGGSCTRQEAGLSTLHTLHKFTQGSFLQLKLRLHVSPSTYCLTTASAWLLDLPPHALPPYCE